LAGKKSWQKGGGWKVGADAEADRAERARLEEMKEAELEMRRKGLRLVAGLDEAGRGCLFGPVVAAAAIMPEECVIYGANDSKKLTEKRREALYAEIAREAVAHSIGCADNFEIDRINILEASKLAMRRALQALGTKADAVLSDAVSFQSLLPSKAIIKGDEKSFAIACASILAKASRDRMMGVYDRVYPSYGFASNKGYATPSHRKALAEFGPTALHRFSFLSGFYAQAGPMRDACLSLIGQGYKIERVDFDKVYALKGDRWAAVRAEKAEEGQLSFLAPQ
jgi:ribonuclease HII